MNKFYGMYHITAEIAEAEPVRERLFSCSARPQRPELRALLARLDREAQQRKARAADRRAA